VLGRRPAFTFFPKVLPRPADRRGVQVRSLVIAVLAPMLAGGCAFSPGLRRALTVGYKPVNVYVRQPVLPQAIRRVAVLPLPRNPEDADQAAGADSLGPLWLAELVKQNVFEVVPVSAEDLHTFTGRSGWSAEDELPLDFFQRLRQATGCDAVLFASLTAYQAYPPLRAGWRARLVDSSQHLTWWSIDELFDAGANSVAVAAEAYARAELNLPNPLLSDTGVLHSPRRFGQYTTWAVASTLPHH